MLLKLSVFLFLFLSQSSFGANHAAVVKIIRGSAQAIGVAGSRNLELNGTVAEGDTIRTAEKSFVKLVMMDKSQMNIGPMSEMKIEKFSGKEATIIDLVKGQIRSQVSKDYMQMKNKETSKVLLKTKNAVLGVRGTDFLISSNNGSTSTVLFEGEIVFNKLDAAQTTNPENLEQMVSNGVRILPGEFSVLGKENSTPTVPSLLNVSQLEKLEKNAEFDTGRSPASQAVEAPKRSMVPAGLSGDVVSSSNESLSSELEKVIPPEPTPATTSTVDSSPGGFVDGDIIKPANGSSIHLESGIVISPGPGAVFDSNTNSFIPAPDMGGISEAGDYIPPSNIEISPEGKMTVTITTSDGASVKKEIAPPPPVAGSGAVSLSSVGIGPTNSSRAPTIVVPDLSTIRPPPSGGIQGVNDPQRTSIPSNEMTRLRVRVR